jgi:hypothetical protein
MEKDFVVKKLSKVKNLLEEERNQVDSISKVYLSKKQRKRILKEAYIIIDSLLEDIKS